MLTMKAPRDATGEWDQMSATLEILGKRKGIGMPVKGQRNIKALKDALARGVAALRHVQHSDGHWCAELEGDSILESEYLLMKFILSQEHEPFVDGSGRERLEQIAEGLRLQQRPEGDWGQYPGSDMDISATVKAYFALKLMGDDPEAEHKAK